MPRYASSGVSDVSFVDDEPHVAAREVSPDAENDDRDDGDHDAHRDSKHSSLIYDGDYFYDAFVHGDVPCGDAQLQTERREGAKGEGKRTQD